MPKEVTIGETVFRKILRDELKGYATKEDLRNELKGYATKEDLKPLATKEHLKMYAATKYDLDIIAVKVDELDIKFNKVMNILDEMHGMLKRNTEELLVMNNRVYRIHDPKIENHEKRITRLEVSVV